MDERMQGQEKAISPPKEHFLTTGQSTENEKGLAQKALSAIRSGISSQSLGHENVMALQARLGNMAVTDMIFGQSKLTLPPLSLENSKQVEPYRVHTQEARTLDFEAVQTQISPFPVQGIVHMGDGGFGGVTHE